MVDRVECSSLSEYCSPVCRECGLGRHFGHSKYLSEPDVEGESWSANVSALQCPSGSCPESIAQPESVARRFAGLNWVVRVPRTTHRA